MLLSVPDAKASGLLEYTEGTFWGLFWHCPPKFLPFAFSPSCLLCFFIFFAVLFFFAGHSLGFVSVGKVSVKTLRIMKLFERKYGWLSNGTKFSLEFSCLL